MAVGEDAVGFSPENGKPWKLKSSYGSEGCSTPTSNNSGSPTPTSAQQDSSFEEDNLWLRHTAKAAMAPGLPGCSPGTDRAPLADDEPVYITCAAGLVPPPPAPYVPPGWTQALEAKLLSECRKATSRESESVLISIGSVGHPLTCEAACKYARRKGGCREGLNCKCCHQCLWSRKAASDEPGRAKQTAAPMRVDQAPPAREWASTERFQLLAAWPKGADEGTGQRTKLCADAFWSAEEEEEEEAPSVGSIGHPYFCAKACKFRSQGKVCKDGRFCVRCHACVWRRCLER